MRRRRDLARPRRSWLVAASGLAVCAPLALAGVNGPVELLSIGPEGTNPVTDRGAPAVNADGRHVAFHSAGRDIDPAEANIFEDVFVRDRQTGTFERISVTPAGGESNGPSFTGPNALTANGDRVAFWGTASNLTPGDSNMRSDVFLRDRSAGTTTMLSSNVAGFMANGSSSDATIDSDGSHVAFTSDAPDLVAGDLNGKPDVFVRDVGAAATTLVSATPSGAPGNGPSGPAVISADGTKVAFVSVASNLVSGDTNARADVFLRDLSAGTTERVSLSNVTGGQLAGESIEPFLSADGRFVGFSSNALGVAGNRKSTSTVHDLYVRDTLLDRTERLSFLKSGIENTSGTTRRGSISADGRLVAFDSTSSAYRPGDSANLDVFVIDRATDEVVRLSETPSGGNANGSSSEPDVGDGGVSFRSTATNMASPGGAFNRQVFFRAFVADPVAADIDGDGIQNLEDVCPTDADASQTDTDRDSRGNACDMDDDGDGVVDHAEVTQESDPLQVDSDGDGANDLADDYPADDSLQVGTEHRGVNVATLDSEDGPAAFEVIHDPSDGRFDLAGTGSLVPRGSYRVSLYRRDRFIRYQSGVCNGTANSSTGAWSCRTSNRVLLFFTHVELTRNGVVLATASCEPPQVGVPERRCNLVE